jgi:ECF transporter S component (folate family)
MGQTPLRVLIFAGLLAAMSFVLKLYLSFTTLDLRISFYDIPLMLGSLLLGPFIGAAIGFASDFAYITMAGFPFSFLMALSAVMWGFLPVLILRRNNVFFLSAAIIITSLVAFSLNTVQLYIWTGSGVFALLPLRFLIVVLKWPIQITVLKILKDRLSPLLQDA